MGEDKVTYFVKKVNTRIIFINDEVFEMILFSNHKIHNKLKGRYKGAK